MSFIPTPHPHPPGGETEGADARAVLKRASQPRRVIFIALPSGVEFLFLSCVFTATALRDLLYDLYCHADTAKGSLTSVIFEARGSRAGFKGLYLNLRQRQKYSFTNKQDFVELAE